MAKESLKQYLNRNLKSKGTTAADEKKKASKYSSISAAKKAGSLYYTDKNGKVMAAVYAGDLTSAPQVRPKARPLSEKEFVAAENKKLKEAEAARNAKKLEKAKEYLKSKRKPDVKGKRRADPLNLAGPGGRGTGLNKGGMARKKKKK